MYFANATITVIEAQSFPIYDCGGVWAVAASARSRKQAAVRLLGDLV